ncbi:MAG: AraC family ligand binding domain-containing protein, partial [Pseudomonadota bacterium]
MNLNAHPADDANAPVVGQSWDVEGPVRIAAHQHRRGQLIYTEAGSVSVEAQGARFVAPPHRAVWLPPGVVHAAFYPRAVAFRGLFFDIDVCREMPSSTAVLQIDPLCRELIRAAVKFPWGYAPNGPEARLTSVLTDRMSIVRYAPLSLPGGKSQAVLKIMAALEDNPADNRSTAEWASFVHLTERTLARKFIADS